MKPYRKTRRQFIKTAALASTAQRSHYSNYGPSISLCAPTSNSHTYARVSVKGLGITLDPSHFTYGENAGRSYDQILKYAYHVHLRDTNKEHLQVRVGQGDIEYGRLVTQLAQAKYNRALAVDMRPLPDVDHMAEMRKIRLLLESLL